MKKNNKSAISNRLERKMLKKEAIAYHQAGTGVFVFRNKNNASLELPKISLDGKKWIEPNQTWKGDSYFFSMVPQDATLVEVITPKEGVKMPEKLVLDQPDQITMEGKVEHIVDSESLPLNEDSPQEKTKTKERLFVEDPLAGVTILRD